MKCEDFSTLSHLFRITSLVVKFVRLFNGNRRKIPQIMGHSYLTLSKLNDSGSSITVINVAQDNKFLTWKKQFNHFLDQNGETSSY